jgi:hypothetical protein
MVVGSQTDAPAALPPVKNLVNHLTAGWMSPRARLDVLEERNISCPYMDPNPESSNRTDNATPAPGKLRMRHYLCYSWQRFNLFARSSVLANTLEVARIVVGFGKSENSKLL